MQRIYATSIMFAHRGHLPMSRCLPNRFCIRVPFEPHHPVLCPGHPPSRVRSNDVYTFARKLPVCLSHLSPFSIPFGFSLRLLRLFHSAPPFTLPPLLSRGNSAATLAVDINKHLDYTVKAASTTSPD